MDLALIRFKVMVEPVGDKMQALDAVAGFAGAIEIVIFAWKLDERRPAS